LAIIRIPRAGCGRPNRQSFLTGSGDVITFQFRGISSPSCHFNLDEDIIGQLRNRHEIQFLPKNLAEGYDLFSALLRAQVDRTYKWFIKVPDISSETTKPVERFLDFRVIQQSLLISLLLMMCG
jgi:hypothetical protein